ncbi:MAG: beta-ketoacyl-[acyl-carrier-protein] synthase family protein [Deltaproteobacteria bacterium]|nr:beta-ketoacyl-[acyl-carrier-protein] synthase family protein [Deltaproteobacteria bacterium]
MRRVVVAGMGVVSSIGNSLAEVSESLRAGRSGVEFLPERKEMGFRSGLAGTLKSPPDPDVPKRNLRQMGASSLLAVPAVREALADAGLSEADVKNERTGIVIGTCSNMLDIFQQCHAFRHEKKNLGGNALQRTMASSVSANLSVLFGTRGHCLAVSAACASGALAILQGGQAIRWGLQDRMICAGVQESSWAFDCNFDALRAFSLRESEPARASRPFDKDRDGLVPSSGCGVVVLEEEESARKRGARIHAELAGWATNSDGFDMTIPSGQGGQRCLELALADAGKDSGDVDYVHAHATSTLVGDAQEAKTIRSLLGDKPWVSSTKSMTGPELAAAGATGVVYTLLMMRDGFVAPSINLDNIDPECAGIRLAANTAVETSIRVAVSNSFGFGGVNTCLVLAKTELTRPDRG